MGDFEEWWFGIFDRIWEFLDKVSVGVTIAFVVQYLFSVKIK